MIESITDNILTLRREDVEALGDHHAAALLSLIAQRCEEDGEWRATVGDLAAGAWLTYAQARRAVGILLNSGCVVVRRSGYDRAGVYALAEQPEGLGGSA